MAEDGWQRELDDPIETPDGGLLHTLREAVANLAKTVPKSERDMPAVTTAAEMLTYAAERGIAWMFLARMATLRAPLGQTKAEAGSVNQTSPTRRADRAQPFVTTVVRRPCRPFQLPLLQRAMTGATPTFQ